MPSSLPNLIPALPELFLVGVALALLLLGVFQKSSDKADDTKRQEYGSDNYIRLVIQMRKNQHCT